MDIKQLEKDFLKCKSEEEIVDINCCLPCYRDNLLKAPASHEAYFSEGVDRMVLTASLCTTEMYSEGNERIFDAAARDERIYASPVIVPEMNLGGKKFASVLEAMLQRKTVIVRMYPKEHRYPLRKWLVGDILGELERRRVPLMLWHMQADWNEFAEIAEAYPDLPIIIEGSDQKTLYYVRSIMGLCEKYRNIYLEMHNFTQYDFLPYALQYVGAERLLFGSRSPFNDMNGPLYQIYTNTDPFQRKLILSENTKRLINGIK
ncbi:MAG: hypothetical protein E7662_12385 [Ruminococcaceae bacterium]|nr:hypothetical protein [Oscillospiraceae bacterium]